MGLGSSQAEREGEEGKSTPFAFSLSPLLVAQGNASRERLTTRALREVDRTAPRHRLVGIGRDGGVLFLLLRIFYLSLRHFAIMICCGSADYNLFTTASLA